MLSYCLNKQEASVVSLSKKSNGEELLSWQIPNVLFPLAVIAFSLIIYVLTSLSSKNFEWSTLCSLLVNGSILMTAFNRMSSMISYTSKIEFDANNAKKLGINLRNVKMKMQTYSFFLVLLIASFYSYQVINRPLDNVCEILIQFIFSGLFFLFAIDATKVAFLLQEAFLSNTYLISLELEQQSIKETPTDNDIKF